MKKNILFILVVLCVFGLFPQRIFAVERSDIVSEAAILMDADTGQVLFEKSGDRMMYPASTTKIMTGWLAAEKCDMSEIVTVAKSAIDIDEWDSANIALSVGEELPLDSLMYGLMLASANDAANAIAEHVSGNQRDFAQIMTERARELGAMNTRFANAHGLHEPTHYTTAYDLALITREAIKNPVFMRYFGAGGYTVPATNLQPQERPLTNYQYMLVSSTQYYNPDVTGGKVGYTNEAKHTMSTVAEKDGRKLICVVMYSPSRGDKFKDTQALLDFGFNEFTKVTVSREEFPGFFAKIVSGSEETGFVNFTSPSDFTALLHDSSDLSTLEISYSHNYQFEDGETVAAAAEFTIAPADNPAIPTLLGKAALKPDVFMFEQVQSASLNLKGNRFGSIENPWIILLIIAAVAIVILVLFFITRQANLRRQRKRRHERLLKLQREREVLYNGTRSRYNASSKEKIPR